MRFGVCGGLAERYGWDATWVRLAFVLGTLIGGPGVVLYLVMALIVPKHRSLTGWQPTPLGGERAAHPFAGPDRRPG